MMKIQDTYVGEFVSPRPHPFPENAKWFCTQCGDLFATRFEDKDGEHYGWVTRYGTCLNCAPSIAWNGRLSASSFTPFRSYDEINAGWNPPELLAWEFLLASYTVRLS